MKQDYIEIERWKKLEESEGYEISIFGNVRLSLNEST